MNQNYRLLFERVFTHARFAYESSLRQLMRWFTRQKSFGQNRHGSDGDVHEIWFRHLFIPYSRLLRFARHVHPYECRIWRSGIFYLRFIRSRYAPVAPAFRFILYRLHAYRTGTQTCKSFHSFDASNNFLWTLPFVESLNYISDRLVTS